MHTIKDFALNDSKLINIFNTEELTEWCVKLNCEQKDLIQAVLDIGPSPNIVDTYLYLNRKKLTQ